MKREVIEGKIQGNARGFGFLIANDGRAEEYFIPHSDLRGAMHGDIVLAETTESGGGARTTARVLKVIQRGISELVGTFSETRSGGFVTPDDSKYFCDIFIPQGKSLRARTGDKVVCKILSYPRKMRPEGIIKEIFGKATNRKAEIKSIIYGYKLPDSFPDNVLDFAEKKVQAPTENDLKGRRDFRSELTFTIDGEDAKDFDDAVSIIKLGDKYRLSVHIADVSEYVTAFSPIDKEAFKRGTSVYFPEMVIPMLPEKLCNDVCSLKEGEDRLTLSTVMTVNKQGKVEDYEIVKGVIKSSARMTYNEVDELLQGDTCIAEKYGDNIKNAIFLMKELAEILIEKRDKNGNINLDVKESAITVKDKKIEITATERSMSHRIIEEFMILTNVTVAEYMYYLDKPFIYRTHEDPAGDKVEEFYLFLKSIGVKVKRRKDEIYPKDFQIILKEAEGKPTYTLINRVMLRSMQKAKYTPDALGHFGLSEKYYCHFTSPIRRYPDLAVHRIIKDVLDGKDNLDVRYGQFVIDASVQSSERERIAIEAERAIDEYYKMLYLTDYIGEEFDGVVSGVVSSGFFVELANGIEGFVHAESISRGNANYDKAKYSLTIGKFNFRLGKSVKIAVEDVDLALRRAEFTLVEYYGEQENRSE
ncbi:MAG: ribonuclease R [Clostridiales bacterium]|nr:ribonuclease R [Clostridiales bacterium]